MKKRMTVLILSAAALWISCKSGSAPELKVFIQADMEGCAGIVSGRECSTSGADYSYYREILTREINAAVDGAAAAGAAEIVVRDGHGAKRNILPELLDKRAKLIRGVTDDPKNMMLGIDGSFDAVIFIGAHAKAGTSNGVIAHTSSGNVIDLTVNGVSLPETGYNALLAGIYDVPAVLGEGDNWICNQARDLLGEIRTVETKQGMGTAAAVLHPETVRDKIRIEVIEALSTLEKYKPYKLTAPYRMVLKVKKERELYPGAKRTGQGIFEFISNDFLKIMDAFNTY